LSAALILSSTVVVALGLTTLLKPAYEAQGKLLIKKSSQTTALTGLGGEKLGQLEGLDMKSSPISTEMEVIHSVPLLQKTIALLNLRDPRGVPITPEIFAKRLKFKNTPTTDVLQVSYESKNPEEATAVVNKLMDLYLENNVFTNRAETIAAGEFIVKQLPQTEATVRQAELALRGFQEHNHLVSLTEESKSAVAIVKELEGKITEVNAALADVNAQYVSLQSKVGMSSGSAIAANTLNQSPGVQKVLESLQQAESDLALKRSLFQEAHPLIQDLKHQTQILQVLLRERIAQSLNGQQLVSDASLQMGASKQKLIDDFVKVEVERLGLANRLALLSQTAATYKRRIEILPKLEQEQRELERQLEAAQSTYQTLLKKLQEVKVQENQNIGNARIIEPALVTVKSTTTQKILIVFVGGMLGMMLATGMVVILEVRDRSIKTLKEARELYGYTLLGAIPSFGKKNSLRHQVIEAAIPELLVRDNPRSPIAEGYRMLQANLKFLSSDKPLQVIVVTSAVPKEGKSTVSANLATAIAQLGRRVLLVDADMRHPLQHHIWNLTNAAGLSDVIVNQAEFTSVVNTAIANLDILTAGVIPPNPLALLDSKRMATLIESFSTTYDFVIIDAPPLAIGADALTLGKMTDGVLLVARPGVVSSVGVTAAKEALLATGQNVLGLVVNGVILKNESDSYFYYAKEYADVAYSKKKVTN
ncbi:MAG: polysaccharide biosynthesis tyrosine autokinase, partial [Nostocaceae cyanobacterium]|nr:polysaccharide biosynthesis tyrosine autokinase [Nostocaceae cyanobacterium]